MWHRSGSEEPVSPVRTPRRASTDSGISVGLLVGQAVLKYGIQALVERTPDLRLASSNCELDADVVVMHFSVEGALDKLRRTSHSVRYVVLADGVRRGELDAVLKSGARGVVVETAEPKNLLSAIRRVGRGLKWVDLEAHSSLIDLDDSCPSPVVCWNTLTERECQVATLMLQGHRYKQVASALGVTEHTVRHHLRKIYEKLHINSRVELVRYADQGIPG